MLSSRKKLIMKELMATKSPITSEALAISIQVTSRTIRNDIKELNEILLAQGASIKSTRGIGYELKIENDKDFKFFLQNIAEKSTVSIKRSPDSPEERVVYIVRKLLLGSDYVKTDDIADELYISKSTLQHDLIEVKKILKKFGLQVESKPYYGIKIIGGEINLRFCLSEYLFDRKEFIVDMTSQINSILSEEEARKIRMIILEEVKVNKIEMSDITLNNLNIHFAIACRRIRDENYILLASEDFEGIHNQIEYEVAKKIVTKIESALHVSFPKAEIAYIAIHLLGTKKIASIDLNKKEFESFVESSLREIIQEIIMKIDDRLNLRLKDDKELFMALGLHLMPAINRLRYGMNVRNPMLEEIKTKYPLAFDAAILAGKVLMEKLELVIDEHEIGYIALHISAAMFRKQVNQDVKRCIIVCASGVGSAMLLKYKLQSMYDHKLMIVGTIDYYRLNEMSLENIDFIITTIPIEKELQIPVIFVNTILKEKDLRNIQDFLQEDHQSKLTFLKNELIYLQKDLKTKEEAIAFLVSELKEAGYVDEFFGDSVFEREKLSPTSYGNLVAIPHPISPLTGQSFWALCTLKRPINWGENRVQFICLLSIGKQKSSDLKSMYESLIAIIEDEQRVKQLINCNEKRKFIELMN